MLSATLPAPAAVAAPSATFVAKTTFVPFTGGSGSPDTVAPITPQQMQTAYGITNSSGSPLILFNGVKGDGTGQTVAIVDAFNDPTILQDSNAFNSFYNLPQFNKTGGPTLTVLGEDGSTTLPTGTDAGWGVEESLDVQWIHAIAPQANIILYEANSANGNDMYATELSAAANPAVTVVSNSWGAGEYNTETQDEASFFLTPVKHQGITFLASTGDAGTPAGFPSFSRDVVAVGGTSLTINTSGVYQSESAWIGTGGGISQFESLPPFQSGLNGINGASTTFRNVPDVAADADPNTGVLVFDSTLTGGNAQFGGTSLACPLWAGMIAIADQGRALAGLGSLNGETQTLPMLYTLPSTDFNDVTTGSNGTYSAGVGYDLVTGIGTPKANLLIPALAGYVPAQPLTISAPSTAGVTAGGSLIFSAANGNAISIADASAGSNSDLLTLSVSHGTLALGSTTGLTFTSGTNNSASFTVSGTVPNLDAALSGLTYQPTIAYLGADSLSVSAVDSGTSQSASTSVSLNVVPLPSTAWTLMTNSLPNGDSGQLALLLPNGKLFVHEGNGSDNSSTWYLVTPDSTGSYVNGTWTQAASMNVGRLFFGSDVLPNGNVFVVGGEYASDSNFSNSAEIYNPTLNKWTMAASSPLPMVGDEPTEVLPGGNILVGDIQGNGSEIYHPATDTWTTGGAKVHTSDVSDEEPWVKLANGDILTYDLFSSITDNKFEAELYNPTTNMWSDASTSSNGSALPLLTTPQQGYELGPALLLPDGRALFTGATGLTVFFNPSNNTWTLGPTMPSVMINGVLTQLTAGDTPAAILPNGDVVVALSPAVNFDSSGNENFPPPTYIYDFNPTANVFTDITPSSSVDPNLGVNTFINTMLVLPTGQILLANDNTQLAIYTPNGTPQAAWKPVVTSFTKNTDGSYTLTGTQLNGLDEGAAYGDDNQMAENYPLVQVTDTTNGHVLYATTSNWTSTGVATGGAPETVNVVLPAALGTDSFTLRVIADGIASNVFSQAPAFTAPNAVSVNQNGVLTFTGTNAISLSDSLGTAEQMTLAVSHGTLSLSAVNLIVTGNGTANVTVSGALSDVNNALANLTYTPTIGYNGSDTLSLSDTDSSDGLSGSSNVAITVSPVAPSITVPAPVVVPMNGTLPFAGANLITVADISGTNEQMTLQVSHGMLTLTPGTLVISGNGSASVTVSGPLATLNTALATLVYTPTPGYSGGDTLSLSDKDTTDALSGAASVPITVEGAPTVSTPTTVTVTENGSLTFSSANNNQLKVADLFADGAFDALTVSVSHGIVTLGSTSGVTITGGANGSSSVTLTGTIDNLNAALNGLIYQPNANFDNSDSLVVSLNNPADGLTGSSSVAISIDALPPTITGPGVATVDENTSLIFSTANGNAISINDINAGGDSLALSVTHGTLTLASTSGLTFTSGTNGTNSFTVTGGLSNLSVALDGLTYQPTLNYFGSDSLSASIKNLADQKASSVGVLLNINAIPTVVAPSSATLTENTAFTFSSANNNEITAADQSAGSNPDSLTLTATSGTITLGSTTGLTFTNGSNGSSSFIVSGTLGNLTAGLNGLTYQPNINFVGGDSLVATLFNPRDSLSGTTTVTLSVNAVAAPTIGAPATGTVAENGTLVFSSGNSNAISIADNGAGGNADSLSMTVSHGTLTLASTTGLLFTSGSNGTASFTVKGTLSNLGAALATVTYQPTANFAGSDSLAILIADTGDGKSGSTSVALAVSALAPSITAPRTAAATENASFAFSGGNVISIADAFPGAIDSLKLSVSHGTLTLASTSGLTFTSGGNGTASFTVTGTVNSLNADLLGLTYQPTAGYFGPDTLMVSVSDPGDSLSGATNVAITVNPLAAPSIAGPASASLVENTSLVFSSANSNAITLGDSVAGSNSDSLTLTVRHGTVTLATISGLTFTNGTNGGASFTVTGTVANLNTALSGLTYRPTTNYTGPDSLAISITDPGDNESASTSVAVTVTAFSPPSISAPVAASAVLNGSLVFSSANNNAITVADPGPGSGADSLKLSVTQGTVTLASTSGLTITSGANGSASITVTGSVANLNAALSGLTYRPTTGYTGTDSLAISLRDSADSLSASSSVALTVAVSAPAITAPPTAAVVVSSSLVFSSANKNAVSIADINAGSTVEPLTLTATSGTLTLGSTNGITFANGANNSTSMTIDGTLANLNAALSGLTFTPAKVGTATVVLSYTDLGNGLMGTASITITVGKGITKLGGGSPASSPATSSPSTSSSPATSSPSTASSSPAVARSSPVSASTDGGTVPATATPTTANGTTTNSSTPPDAETQWRGVSAAVEVLIG